MIKDLIKFLKTLPEDTELSVFQPDCGGYDVTIVDLGTPKIIRIKDSNVLVNEFYEKQD